MYSLLSLLKVQFMFMEWSLVTFTPVPLFTVYTFCQAWVKNDVKNSSNVAVLNSWTQILSPRCLFRNCRVLMNWRFMFLFWTDLFDSLAFPALPYIAGAAPLSRCESNSCGKYSHETGDLVSEEPVSTSTFIIYKSIIWPPSELNGLTIIFIVWAVL